VRPVVLTLGTFDGVHRGHQALLAMARRRADRLGGDVLAVAFDRPPRLFFAPLPPPTLLTSPLEKEHLLRQFGADRVETIHFSRDLADLTESQFIQKFLKKRWNAAEVVVGFNFCFGKGRTGTPKSLSQWGKTAGVRVHSVGPVRDHKGVISSGRIRPLVGAGSLREAQKLLGHDYTLDALVVPGRGVGRRIGFPTANLKVSEEKIIPSGVFAVKIELPTGPERKGLLNVGFRPTFQSYASFRSVEAHILDFSGDLSGRRLRLTLTKKLRDEKKFSSVQTLVRQIRADEMVARRILF
jgi:riboflavin kinase/FMN adenylyltransferase